jgi:hypothetical protein
MDWMMQQWFFDNSLRAPIAPTTPLDTRPPPTELERTLVEIFYLVLANETRCGRCGHLLGRGLRVRASTGLTRWPVRVEAKCWGWRRHPFAAAVTQPSKDLVFGTLHRRVL